MLDLRLEVTDRAVRMPAAEGTGKLPQVVRDRGGYQVLELRQQPTRQHTGVVDLTSHRVRQGLPYAVAGSRAPGTRRNPGYLDVERGGGIGGLPQVVQAPGGRHAHGVSQCR